jgi:hypothetical protein
MLNDPIVGEVRQVKDELAKAFGHDVHEVFADMRKRASQFGKRLINPQPQKKPNTSVQRTEVPSADL